MKKNRNYILRIILFIIVSIIVAILIFFQKYEMLIAMKDSLIVMTIVMVLLFAELDKDKIKSNELKAYNEGYEQGIKYGRLKSNDEEVKDNE